MKANNYEKRIEQLEKQITDLKDQLIESGEDVLESTSETAEDYRNWVRQKLGDSIDTARDSAMMGIKRVKRAGKQADEYVHEHPWSMIAGGVAAGLLIGFLISRRHK